MSLQEQPNCSAPITDVIAEQVKHNGPGFQALRWLDFPRPCDPRGDDALLTVAVSQRDSDGNGLRPSGCRGIRPQPRQESRAGTGTVLVHGKPVKRGGRLLADLTGVRRRIEDTIDYLYWNATTDLPSAAVRPHAATRPVSRPHSS